MSFLLRSDIADQVRRRVRVPVDMAVEARNAEARTIGATIVDVVELLLREGRRQQAQAVELFGIQKALEQLVVVVRRDQLALRNIAQVRLRRQEDGRLELGQKLVRQVEVEIEALQVAAGLQQQLVDAELREEHAAFWLFRMGEREKPEREQILSL